MNVELLIVLMVAMSAVIIYTRQLFMNKQQSVRASAAGKSKNKTVSHQLFETNPEQASHNLEYSDQPQRWKSNHPPIRDPLDADFAAEAHGFTGFEMVGRGSRYKSSERI